MKRISKTLTIVIAVVIIAIVLFFGYRLLTGNDTKGGIVVQTGTAATSGGDSAQSQEIIALLKGLNSIKIDTSIFSSNAFQSLEDITSALRRTDNYGRPNPFSPIGLDILTEEDEEDSLTIPDSSQDDELSEIFGNL